MEGSASLSTSSDDAWWPSSLTAPPSSTRPMCPTLWPQWPLPVVWSGLQLRARLHLSQLEAPRHPRHAPYRGHSRPVEPRWTTRAPELAPALPSSTQPTCSTPYRGHRGRCYHIPVDWSGLQRQTHSPAAPRHSLVRGNFNFAGSFRLVTPFSTFNSSTFQSTFAFQSITFQLSDLPQVLEGIEDVYTVWFYTVWSYNVTVDTSAEDIIRIASDSWRGVICSASSPPTRRLLVS